MMVRFDGHWLVVFVVSLAFVVRTFGISFM